MRRSLIKCVLLVLAIMFLNGFVAPFPAQNKTYSSPTPFKDRQCSDCVKYMSFMINSKKWSICGVLQPEQNTAPIIYRNKTYCMVRTIPETIGCSVSYNAATRKIFITKKATDRTVILQEGNPIASINGEDYQIDEKDSKITPINRNGSTLMPIKFIIDVFGLNFEWYAKTKQFIIEYTDPACVDPLKFSLPDTDDKMFDFDTIKDKPVLLDFSGSWCQPCWEAYPTLKKLYEEYKDKVIFISIMLDNKDDAANEKEDNELPWTILYEEDGRVGHSIDVYYYPSFVTLDKNHKIMDRSIGFDEESTENTIRQMLDKLH